MYIITPVYYGLPIYKAIYRGPLSPFLQLLGAAAQLSQKKHAEKGEKYNSAWLNSRTCPKNLRFVWKQNPRNPYKFGGSCYSC